MSQASVSAGSGASDFEVAREKRQRLVRIGVLLLAYLAPQFVDGTNRLTFRFPELGFLVPDTLYELIVWGAVGVQVYLLKRSALKRPRTFVFGSTHGLGEVLMYAAGVAVAMSPSVGLLPGLHRQSPLMTQLVLATIYLIGVLLITVRGTVVIDGENQRVLSLGLLPKARPFQAVEALGKLEYRRGSLVAFYLTIFFRDGKYWKLTELKDVDIPAEAARIAATTGLPTRDRAMPSPTR